MRVVTTPEATAKLCDALGRMSEALDILDELDAPGEIGTSLDLAIARLEQCLGRGAKGSSGVQDLMDQVEGELLAMPEATPEVPVPWETQPG